MEIKMKKQKSSKKSDYSKMTDLEQEATFPIAYQILKSNPGTYTVISENCCIFCFFHLFLKIYFILTLK